MELPLLQRAFGIASLDTMHCAVCIAMASTVLRFDELRKLLYRMLERNKPGKP